MPTHRFVSASTHKYFLMLEGGRYQVLVVLGELGVMD
jgi:hypothetical protein